MNFGTYTSKELKNKYLKIWWDTTDEFPCFEKSFDVGTQKCKGREMDTLLDNLSKMVDELAPSAVNGNKNAITWSDSKKLLHQAGKDILELEDAWLGLILEEGFNQSTSGFIKEAGKFDHAIQMEDIMQAMRNVWIMNCIQILLGREVSHTPSIFAYSMLYPYNDNYLDDISITNNEKKATMKKFGARIAGERLLPSNKYEQALFRLIGMIESQYPREDFAVIYQSLLAILAAQQDSLAQQRGAASPYETDILGISFEKGGTSVLADAFLVNGTLSSEQISFMYGFGIFLQLADDLQDAGSDRKNGHMTMFSQTSGKWTLDKITNKLFNFTFHVLDSDKCFSSEKMKDMKNVIKYNCAFLLLGAIAHNRKLYSRDYLKKIEKYSPLRFLYMKKFYTKLQKEYSHARQNLNGPAAQDAISAALAG